MIGVPKKLVLKKFGPEKIGPKKIGPKILVPRNQFQKLVPKKFCWSLTSRMFSHWTLYWKTFGGCPPKLWWWRNSRKWMFWRTWSTIQIKWMLIKLQFFHSNKETNDMDSRSSHSKSLLFIIIQSIKSDPDWLLASVLKVLEVVVNISKWFFKGWSSIPWIACQAAVRESQLFSHFFLPVS